MKVFEKKQMENNREYAYRLLRDNIMTFRLVPGQSLNENELSELMHVSRTPVHEAILMLKEESLVDVFPQSVSRVSGIDLETLNVGLFLRLQVEPVIISQTAGNLTKEQIVRLKENLEAQETAALQETYLDTFFKIDDEFHRMIYEFAKKARVWRAVRSVCSHYDRVRYLDAIDTKANIQIFVEEHKTIYSSLLSGEIVDFDFPKFYEGHLATYRKHFRQMLEKYPEYFNL